MGPQKINRSILVFGFWKNKRIFNLTTFCYRKQMGDNWGHRKSIGAFWFWDFGKIKEFSILRRFVTGNNWETIGATEINRSILVLGFWKNKRIFNLTTFCYRKQLGDNWGHRAVPATFWGWRPGGANTEEYGKNPSAKLFGEKYGVSRSW